MTLIYFLLKFKRRYACERVRLQGIIDYKQMFMQLGLRYTLYPDVHD